MFKKTYTSTQRYVCAALGIISDVFPLLSTFARNVSFTRRMEDSVTPDPAPMRVSGSAGTLKGFPRSRKGASSEGDPRPFAAAGARVRWGAGVCGNSGVCIDLRSWNQQFAPGPHNWNVERHLHSHANWFSLTRGVHAQHMMRRARCNQWEF